MGKVVIGVIVLLAVAIALSVPGSVYAKIGGGDIVFKLSGAANVTYSHDFHVGTKGLKCNNCHYKIFTTVEGHKKHSMEDMQKGESCGACHDGKTAFGIKGNCDKCHAK
jgi:c(7)-type cytochrome triheme protein